jgi:hypothetical protein
MRASEFTMQQRRAYLRAIFARPRGARLHELIDVAVHAFEGDGIADDAPQERYEFPAPRRRAEEAPARVAV